MKEAGAAIAAADLLALLADPVRHRPRLTHGREPFPGALHAFRFAQGRFPPGVIRKLSAQERDRLREAAVFFIRQVCLWGGASHYQVLGVAPDASQQTIKEHYQVLMALLHPDRQDTSSERWPAAAAPRVNQAYAVLSDGALRREYEEGLASAAQPPRGFADFDSPPEELSAARVPAHRRSSRTRSRVRGALVATAALAALFFLNVWMVDDDSSPYATLRTATPVERSWQWMKEAVSSGNLPRFLGNGEGHAAATAALNEDPVSRPRKAVPPDLSPLMRVGATQDTQPEAVRPVEKAPAPRADIPATNPKVSPSPPTVVAQAQAPVPTPASTADVGQLEMLVMQLVAHYEAGELDRLLALFDANSVGVFEAMSVRNDFEEFFRVTRERRLRIQSVSWEPAGQPVRARGEALLAAAYKDRPERIDRVAKLEVGIAWRDGRPRIVRLSLFPHE